LPAFLSSIKKIIDDAALGTIVKAYVPAFLTIYVSFQTGNCKSICGKMFTFLKKTTIPTSVSKQ